jgi:hypothetical protein
MLAVLFPVSTQAQYPLLEYIQPVFKATLEDIEYVGHGNWIYANLGQIVKIDAYGNTLWHYELDRYSFQNSNSYHPNSLAIDQTADKGVVVALSGGWVCQFLHYFTGLVKLDSTGQEVWRYQTGENFEYFSDVLALSSGNILSSYGNFLYSFDPAGNLLDSLDYQMGEVKNLREKNHQILLACENGIMLLDSLGSLEDSVSWSKSISDFLSFGDSTYLVLADQQLYLLDATLNPVDSLAVPVDYGAVVDLIPDTAGVGTWLIGKQKAGLISPAFQLQAGFAYHLPPSVSVHYADVSPQHILLGADIDINHNPRPLLKSFDKSGQTLRDSLDVGIATVNVNSFSFYSPYYTGTTPMVNYNITVTVVNQGQVPVDRFYLNSRDLDYYWDWDCFGYPIGRSLLIPVEQAMLMPGDSMQITRDCRDVGDSWNGGDTSYSYTFCLWTSSPHDKIDFNPGNDLFCKTMTGTVGLDELLSKPTIPLQIYPNPASDHVWVETPKRVESITLMDLQGRILLYVEPIAGMSPLRLDLPALETGLYLLEAKSQEGSGIAKLLIR